MPARQQAVPEVRSREDQRPADGEQPIGNEAKVAVCNRRTDYQQTEAGECGEHDSRVTVACIADADRDDA